jgi:hypothetical protein
MREVAVLVGSCLYESRHLGRFFQGGPPRASQQTAFRDAVAAVNDHARTRVRVPSSLVRGAA